MKLRLGVSSLCLIIGLISFMSCEKSDIIEPETVPDYARAEHWLSLPTNLTKDVDVFYLYLTAWYKKDPSEPNFCAIDNPVMLAGSRSAFNRQATAFETAGNIYAPYYRQADAVYTLSLPENERWEVIANIPAKDATAAFDYYIKNFNKGKPFILVGHSQGSNVLLLLLKNYMHEHPEVYGRMVCAYVIGYPVTQEYMQANRHLRFAEGPNDTGVIVSFNTQSPAVAPGNNIVLADNIGLVINPINWKRDETPAPANENKGSYMPVDNHGNFRKIPNFADVRINLTKGVIECTSVDEEAMYQLSGAMGLGVNHSFDIPFYYYNLRENAENRIGSYQESASTF